MKSAWKVCGIMLLATTLVAQNATPPKSKRAPAPSIASQLKELKDAIDAQQQQIQQLGQQIQNRDQQIQQLQQRLDQSQAAAVAAQAKADAAASQAAQEDQSVSSLRSDVADIKLNATNSAQTLQDMQKSFHDQIDSPLAIHFKGITITPGGFLAGESVYRNRALASDINTPFNSVNMPGAGQNQVSEFFGSGRQSRITMLAEGKLSDLKMSGYYEADFLSAAITSNNNESNSYSLRQRQVWGQVAADNGWSLTGGQMWSLVTETKKGMDNRTEAVPMTIDPQYTVGFSWARQYGVRVVKNFNDHFWLGASLENPQTTFSASGLPSNTYNVNFALGSAGNGSGLYNSGITACSPSTSSTGAVVVNCTNAANYSFNAMPDFIFKAAAEPGFGHYEIFAILSRYRDRVYPCAEVPTTGPLPGCPTSASAEFAYNDSQTAGGFGANARWTFAKQFDIGIHFLTGQGVGRYGTGGLPDATVHGDGTLALIRSYQALGTVEWHAKKFDLYMNAGEEYAGRNVSLDPVRGVPVGYGEPTLAQVESGTLPAFSDSGCYTETPPATGTGGFGFGSLSSCNGNTQRLIEGTIGFWIRVHQGPKGRLQFGPQYSYVSRDAWWGAGKTAGTYLSPHGIDNMFFTSFRYYLP